MAQDSQEDLKSGATHWAHTIAKAGLSAIPIIGGPAAELFAALVIPPLTRRRDEWIRSIAEGLKELEQRAKGFNIESLVGNEAFVTSVMHASQVALRNHQKEKLDALRNAVLNVAVGRAPIEDLQAVFLAFVDGLTPWHMRVLRFFQQERPIEPDDEEYVRAWLFGEFDSILEFLWYRLPELKSQPSFSRQVVKDLVDRGLVNIQDKRELTPLEFLPKRTTALGEAFIRFITSPIPGVDS